MVVCLRQTVRRVTRLRSSYLGSRVPSARRTTPPVNTVTLRPKSTVRLSVPRLRVQAESGSGVKNHVLEKMRGLSSETSTDRRVTVSFPRFITTTVQSPSLRVDETSVFRGRPVSPLTEGVEVHQTFVDRRRPRGLSIRLSQEKTLSFLVHESSYGP